MRSATFNRTSTHVLVRDRPAAGAGGSGRGGFGGGRGGGGAEAPARGSDAILYDLTTGLSLLRGSAGDAGFNRSGDLLAYTVDAEARDGNGLFVIDLASGSTRALDNDARTYARLAWNDAGTGVAALKGREVPKMRERDNVLLVVPDVRTALEDAKRAPVTLDTTTSGFPGGWVISERAALSWSEDGARVFLGAMPQTPAGDTVRVESSDSTTDVDIWRTADRNIQSEQMARAARDRNFTYTLGVRRRPRGLRGPHRLHDARPGDLDGRRWAVGATTAPTSPTGSPTARTSTA